MDTWAAIATAVLSMQATNVGQQHTVRGRLRTLGPAAPSMVAAGRDLKHPAHEPDQVLVTVILDEAEPHRKRSAFTLGRKLDDYC